MGQGIPADVPAGAAESLAAGTPTLTTPAVSLADIQRVWAGTVSTQATPGTSLKPEVTVQDQVSAAEATVVDGAPGKLTATLRMRSLSLSEGINKASTTAAGDVDFVLSQLLGHGGMGLVYRAHQVAVDREIAVKLIRPDMTDQPGVREAFFTEAVVTADLDHPNIVPIHDLGITSEGQLFYAMKEVRGVSWAKVIQEKSLEENLDILLRVCDAVAFAHARDVVHRDLKPENVMLGEFGEVLVMDWGLAISVSAQGKAKRLGVGDGPAGTPAYMAPEMARGDWAAIGPASDVFLLGAMLFEIVTGLRPHTGTTVQECLLAAANNVIQSVTQTGELLRIARHAMATDPAARYASVKFFQQALRDYRTHAESVILADKARTRLQEIAAIPEAEQYRECNEVIAAFQQALELWRANSAAVHGLRQMRERFAEFALGRGDLSLAQSQVTAIEKEVGAYSIGGTPLAPPAALAAQVAAARAESARRERRARLTRRLAIGLGLAVIVVSLAAYLVTTRQRDRAVAAEQVAKTAEKTALDAKARTEAANRELEWQNYINLMTAVQAKLDAGVVNQAQNLLWQTPVRLRGWEWGYQIQRCHPELLSVPSPGDCPIASVSVFPNGREMLVGLHSQTVAVYDCADGRILRQIKPLKDRFFSFAVLVGGDGAVGTGAMDGSITLWDPDLVQPRWSVPAHQGQVRGLAASANGRRLVSWGTLDKMVKVWDIVTAKQMWFLDTKDLWVTTAAFSPDSQRVVVAYQGGVFKTFAADTGTELQSSKLLFGDVTAVAFSPDGARIAGAAVGRGAIWPAADPGKYTLLHGHRSWVASACFSPTGQTVLTASADGSVRLWEASTGRELRLYLGHDGTVNTAVFFPDGKRFVSAGGDDNKVKIWATEGTPPYRTLDVQTSNVMSVAFSPDGTHVLASCWEGGKAKLMSVATGECVREFKGHAGPVAAVAFSADGRRVLTGSHDKTVKMWEAATSRELMTFAPQVQTVSSVAFAPDGSTVLTRAGETPRGVTLWDTTSGKSIWFQENANGAAYSPDGRYILAGMWLKDAATGKTIRVIEPNSVCAFSPDSRYFLMPSTITQVGLYEVASGAKIREFVGHLQPVKSVTFSPDGRCAITGGWDETVRIWDVATGRELAAVSGGGQRVYSVALSPDGRLLAMGQMGLRPLSILESLPPTTTPEQVQEWKRARYREWLKRNP